MLVVSALLTAGMLALTGCADEIEIPVQPLPEPAEPEAPEPEMHSLDWYVDQVWNEHARVEQAEEIIAGCMAFNGFEYIPEVGSPSDDAEPTPEELLAEAERIGYGIVASYRASLDIEDPIMTGPNAEYFESLDADEQQEYRDALDGTQENGFEGCRSEAQLFTMNTDPSRVYQDETFRELITDLGAIPSVVAADERVGALEAEWQACMGGAGIADPGPRDALSDALEAEFHALPEQSDELLEEFLTQEIEVATADASCAITVDWASRMTEIEEEYENDFVDTHRAELEALVEKYGV